MGEKSEATGIKFSTGKKIELTEEELSEFVSLNFMKNPTNLVSVLNDNMDLFLESLDNHLSGFSKEIYPDDMRNEVKAYRLIYCKLIHQKELRNYKSVVMPTDSYYEVSYV